VVEVVPGRSDSEVAAEVARLLEEEGVLIWKELVERFRGGLGPEAQEDPRFPCSPGGQGEAEGGRRQDREVRGQEVREERPDPGQVRPGLHTEGHGQARYSLQLL